MISRTKIFALGQLIRFDKPIGTLLLLWPTLCALWIASRGRPHWHLLIIFTAGTFLTRSAGCIVNDLADRHLDAAVTRTRARPLVTGAVTPKEAIVFCLALLAMAFCLVLLTNTLTLSLSVAAVLLASAYPFMKRYTHWPQLVLGLAFSWGIPMAFAAQSEQLPQALWLLFAGNLLWIVVYDTEYAMVDRDDDLLAGIRSTAILFGRYDRLIIGILQVLCLFAFYLAGRAFGLAPAYYAALTVAAGLFVYQQYLIRNRSAEGCFKAFLHNNWVGFVLFAGTAASFVE